MRLSIVALSFFSVAAVLSGCKPPAAAPSAPAVTTVAAVQPAAQPAAKQTVSKIVFIDKEKACECTQKAIDASWTALQAALNGAAVPVERIHMDTQEAFAAGYRAKKPMVAVPGLYFLAEGGAIVEMLQGEVTTAQIQSVLK